MKWVLGAGYNYMAESQGLDAVRGSVETLPTRLGTLFPDLTYRSVAIEKAIYQIPPYPAPAVPVVTHHAIIGRWDRARGFCGLFARHGTDRERGMSYVDVEFDGFQSPELRLYYVHRLVGAPQPLQIVREGNRLYYTGREPGLSLLLIGVRDQNLGSIEEMFLGPTVIH
jgi:hypothetical protein